MLVPQTPPLDSLPPDTRIFTITKVSLVILAHVPGTWDIGHMCLCSWHACNISYLTCICRATFPSLRLPHKCYWDILPVEVPRATHPLQQLTALLPLHTLQPVLQPVPPAPAPAAICLKCSTWTTASHLLLMLMRVGGRSGWWPMMWVVVWCWCYSTLCMHAPYYTIPLHTILYRFCNPAHFHQHFFVSHYYYYIIFLLLCFRNDCRQGRTKPWWTRSLEVKCSQSE